MASNQKQKDSTDIQAVISSTAKSGDPVLVGSSLTGVALADPDSRNGYQAGVSCAGIFTLSVKGIDGSGNSAVVAGDPIYYTDGDTPKLSKKATGLMFGYALGAVGSGLTASVDVLQVKGASGSGGGGGTPGGSSTQLQINSSGSFGGDANLTYSANQLRVGPTGTMFVGPDESSLNPFIQGYTGGANLLTDIHSGSDFHTAFGIEAEQAGSGTFFAAYIVAYGGDNTQGLEVDVYGTGDGATITGLAGIANSLSGSSSSIYPIASQGQVQGTTSNAVIYDFYNYKPRITDSATVATRFGFYSDDIGGLSITNPYYSWFDSRGVRRVKEDNTFDSVGQAIEALYNPQFTKYTPGAANYERVVLGQWNGNVAEIGVEAGGTGTLRSLRLIGNGTLIPAATASSIPLGIQRATSQTADLLRFLDTDGTTLIGTEIDKNGVLTILRNTAPADGDLAANQAKIWFDPSNGAAKLMIRAKQADGTVKTGSVAVTT